jgi:TM2 domain-containing membrane protein YozV
LEYFLLIFFGGLGLHKFYLGKIGEGIAYLFVGTIDFISLQVIIFNAGRYWEPSFFTIILLLVSVIFLLNDLFTLSEQVSKYDKKLRIDLLAQFGIIIKKDTSNENSDDTFLDIIMSKFNLSEDYINVKNYEIIEDDEFIDNKDGTVTHKKTGLMWQRFAVGQTWDGNNCNGNGQKINWEDATKLKISFSGYNDWRLPTKNELMTLTSTKNNSGLYWSSTSVSDNDKCAWLVNFYSNSLDFYHKSNKNHVRLVRSI